MLDRIAERTFAAAPRDSILPLQARGLRFDVGGRRLVDGVDVDLVRSSRLVVIGPNGAGKSLLLKLLHGLIVPTGGTMTWNGRPLGSEARAGQAMVFQRPVLLRRSVMANLDHALAVRKHTPAERRRRIERALHLGRLEAQARQPARTLSGGEQQRLALVRALALEPEVLFLDEPTANLDPASALAVEEIIEAACRLGTTVVLVTHDLGQARRHADRVLLMHAGRAVEMRDAASFFLAPESDAAKAFLSGKIVI